MKESPHPDHLLELIKSKGVFRSQELERQGISRAQIKRLHDRGLVERIGRGLYRALGSEVTEHQTLVEACKRVPQGVVCLLSALQFHGLTTQSPFEVWLALDLALGRPAAPQTSATTL